MEIWPNEVCDIRVLWIKKRVDSMRGWDGAISEVVSSVEFAHVESDWYEACNGFNTIGGRCLKSASDPKSCLALHFFQFINIFYDRGTFKEPEVESVQCNG